MELSNNDMKGICVKFEENLDDWCAIVFIEGGIKCLGGLHRPYLGYVFPWEDVTTNNIFYKIENSPDFLYEIRVRSALHLDDGQHTSVKFVVQGFDTLGCSVIDAKRLDFIFNASFNGEPKTKISHFFGHRNVLGAYMCSYMYPTPSMRLSLDGLCEEYTNEFYCAIFGLVADEISDVISRVLISTILKTSIFNKGNKK